MIAPVVLEAVYVKTGTDPTPVLWVLPPLPPPIPLTVDPAIRPWAQNKMSLQEDHASPGKFFQETEPFDVLELAQAYSQQNFFTAVVTFVSSEKDVEKVAFLAQKRARGEPMPGGIRVPFENVFLQRTNLLSFLLSAFSLEENKIYVCSPVSPLWNEKGVPYFSSSSSLEGRSSFSVLAAIGLDPRTFREEDWDVLLGALCIYDVVLIPSEARSESLETLLSTYPLKYQAIIQLLPPGTSTAQPSCVGGGGALPISLPAPFSHPLMERTGTSGRVESFSSEGFFLLDAEVAQLQLTNHLRARILEGIPRTAAWEREGNNILERWLLSMANDPGSSKDHVPWAKVYRRSTLDEGFNRKMAEEFVEKEFSNTLSEAESLVASLLEQVDVQLRTLPFATGASPQCEKDTMSYGTSFRIDLNPRLRQLVSMGGCEKALAVALRYTIVGFGGQQWGLPQKHIDHLYEKYHVRKEGFASPLNSRLLGKPGAHFGSLFFDTDAPFGSMGSFFQIRWGEHPGNWTINPPFVEDLMERMARHLETGFETSPPFTAFVLIPAWKDSEAYRLLHESPYMKSELFLPRGAYAFEDPWGRKIPATPTIYFALSTEKVSSKRLASALRSIRTPPPR